MKLPPIIMRLRVVEGGRRKIALWFPLFLLWPAMLVFAVLVLPLALLLALIAAGLRGVCRLAMICWHLYASICALRGLNVEINGGDDHVLVSVK